MATFHIEKIVSALPATLAPDTVYMIRTGAGFDLYVSDATGSVAHKVNSATASSGGFYDGGTPSQSSAGTFKVDFGGVV
jgi:hypothetical protein